MHVHFFNPVYANMIKSVNYILIVDNCPQLQVAQQNVGLFMYQVGHIISNPTFWDS